MKKSKVIPVIIILLIIVLTALGGYIYLKINNSPKKLFTTTISKAFDQIKKEQKNYTTVKEKIELSANIESDDESLQAINKILESAKVKIESEVDLKNLFINGNINVEYENESLINASLLLQEEKIYVALKDWFDKYIQMPDDEYDISVVSDMLEKTTSINKELLIDTVKQELINVVSKQAFSRETVTLDLDGKETRVAKSSLKLNNEQAQKLLKDFLTNLKNNSNFQIAIGLEKENIIKSIDEIINNISESQPTEETVVTISIYTKGLLNQFVGVDFVVSENNNEIGGIAFIKKNETNYEYYVYENNDETRKYVVRAIEEKNNNDGTITITIPNDDEDLEIVCKYKKNNNQITYEITSEINSVKFNASGNIIIEENKYSGNVIISIAAQEYGTVKLSSLYSIEYNMDIERIDVSNSVKADEMTEDDQQKLITNVQNSKFYKIINDNYLNPLNSATQGMSEILTDDVQDVSEIIKKELSNINQEEDDTTVSLDNFRIKYNVPDKLKYINYSRKNSKTYTDDKFSTAIVSIEKENASNYLESLSNNFILTSTNYSNQNITDILDYNFNDKTFKYRGITYKDTLGEYLNLYFTYKLSDDYTYVVEATIEGDSLSLDQITEFLNIEITNENTSI